MNNSKLEKLMQSPSREGMLTRLKHGSAFWDYGDKKCKYHRSEYGDGYNHAKKIFEKNIGKSFNIAVNALKNDSRYKHNHFFRIGVDETIKDVKNNSFNYLRFDSDYHLEDNIIVKRETRNRYRYKKKEADPTADYVYKYLSGVEIHRRNGIHYFLIEGSKYVSLYKPTIGEYGYQIPDRFEQLGKYWLKFYKLNNLILPTKRKGIRTPS